MSFLTLVLVTGLMAFLAWRAIFRHQEGRHETADLREALGMPAIPPPHVPFSPWGLVGALVLLFLSWAAFAGFESNVWRYGLAVLLAFWAGRRLCSNLSRVEWPGVLARPGPGFAGVLLLVGAAWSINADIRSMNVEQAVLQAEDNAVAVVSVERRPWQAGRGVAEVSHGPFLIWLAMPTYVAVDSEREAALERSGRAERLIPVDVVILNNSFGDAELDPASYGGRLWSAWVTRAGSEESLAEWSASWPGEKALFEPARRADFPVDWDGRDTAGALLPAGEYVVHLEAAAVPGGPLAQAELALSIGDAGPVVVESPVTAWPRQMIENQQLMDQMRRNMDMFQRMQFDQLRNR